MSFHKYLQRAGFLPWFVAAWCIVVAVGVGAMLGYEYTPGKTIESPPRWPDDSALPRASGRPTLVMFVHPRCPCSRASMAELEQFAAEFHSQVALRIVFFRPAEAASDWDQTDLWRTAQRIPGAVLHRDTSGVEAARFAAMTSGETMLYGLAGELLFHGGMTASRGHQGDNAGREALSQFVSGDVADHRQTPVYGCCLTHCVPPSEDRPSDAKRDP